MDLKDHYNNLWTQAKSSFDAHQFKFDPFLQKEKDHRYGMTLLARPPASVKHVIVRILDNLVSVAPGQYYYPESDLHITILSIISCYPYFSPDDVDTDAYCQLISPVLSAAKPFRIAFRGVTASPSCILIQGFPESNQPNHIRDSLRKKFKRSGLKHSIDARYQLQTAHITVVRFKQPFINPDEFINKITKLRHHDFGSCRITKLELVANDWYHQERKVKIIDTFELSPPGSMSNGD